MTKLVAPNDVALVQTDNAIVAPSGERITIVRDSLGRIRTLIAPDGTTVAYAYDSNGRLSAARSLSTGATERYAYASGATGRSRLSLVSTPQGGAAIRYGDPVVVEPIVADLGSAHQFTGTITAGELTEDATDRYVFAVRESELASTPNGLVLVGVEVIASDVNRQPEVPAIAGLTPLLARQHDGRAFALFAISEPGLHLLEIAANDAGSSGGYELEISIIGDVNRDGLVDGSDAQLQEDALGATPADTHYLPAADADRDGVIDATDI